MSRITVDVSAMQVLPVLDGLLTLYEVRADAVAGHARDCMADRAPATVLQREGASLSEIEDAIDQLGWTRVPRDEPAELTAEREIIATAVHAALMSSAEEIVEKCHAHDLPDGDLSPLSEAFAQAIETHHLLYAVSDAPPPSTPPRRGNPLTTPDRGRTSRMQRTPQHSSDRQTKGAR